MWNIIVHVLSLAVTMGFPAVSPLISHYRHFIQRDGVASSDGPHYPVIFIASPIMKIPFGNSVPQPYLPTPKHSYEINT